MKTNILVKIAFFIMVAQVVAALVGIGYAIIT